MQGSRKLVPEIPQTPDLAGLSAVRVLGESIEIAVRDLDILRDQARGFEEKFRRALAHRPAELVVRLEARELTTAALGRLLRARAEAAREGVRFRLRSEGEEVLRLVRSLGVARVLGIPD